MLDERFWSKVDKTETCWNWTAGCFKSGYGAFSVNGKPQLAHRLALENKLGVIENHALHFCGNRRCVNPDHLYDGTQVENVKDMLLVGNNAKGSKHGHAKLSESQVLEMRSMSGIKSTELAVKYGISVGVVNRILAKTIWRHI